MKRALIPLAEGVEEMEAVAAIDVLRRAEWEVTVAGLHEGPITASRGVRIIPDTVWGRFPLTGFDVLVIPGGTRGVDNLIRDRRVVDAVKTFNSASKEVAAICAGPLVLQEAGILFGKKATCHPGVAAKLHQTPRLDEEVVVDGHIITSEGAGTAVKFALTIVTQLEGQGKAEAVAREMAFKNLCKKIKK